MVVFHALRFSERFCFGTKRQNLSRSINTFFPAITAASAIAAAIIHGAAFSQRTHLAVIYSPRRFWRPILQNVAGICGPLQESQRFPPQSLRWNANAIPHLQSPDSGSPRPNHEDIWSAELIRYFFSHWSNSVIMDKKRGVRHLEL